MKIRLDEDDITQLRYIRSHPGTNYHNYDRFLALELAARCPEKNAKEAAKNAKKCAAKFNSATKRLSKKPSISVWQEVARAANDTVNWLSASEREGYKLTERGAQLLRDIDKAIRDATWNVSDKAVDLEVNV